jgi:hypothetical protein
MRASSAQERRTERRSVTPHCGIEVRPMKTIQYAATVALAIGLATPSHVQIRTGVERSIGISQYCIPPDHSADVQKLYCRDAS